MLILENEIYIKKLYYQSLHRGCKESDFVLSAFAEKYLYSLDIQMLKLYEEFINENDNKIMSWVYGVEPFPAKYVALKAMIMECVGAK